MKYVKFLPRNHNIINEGSSQGPDSLKTHTDLAESVNAQVRRVVYPSASYCLAPFLNSLLLGASVCVKLGLYEEAITWCDKGLAVSF